MSKNDDKKNHLKVVGNKNFVINESKGVVLNINSTQRQVNKITPSDEHITSSQARRIQEIVNSLAEKDSASGMSKRQAFAKWYNAIRKRFDVPSYHLIPSHLGDDTIKWLQQNSAIKRKNISTNKQPIKNEYYAAIWARAKQLGMTKGDVYHIVNIKLNKTITSLTNLSNENIKKLYDIIMRMK
ncbi:TPA: hypothetical protein VEO38_000481 [Providencia alcalifaciens]|nr:hypothetical protein [Providencia alcalifaciens]